MPLLGDLRLEYYVLAVPPARYLVDERTPHDPSYHRAAKTVSELLYTLGIPLISCHQTHRVTEARSALRSQVDAASEAPTPVTAGQLRDRIALYNKRIVSSNAWLCTSTIHSHSTTSLFLYRPQCQRSFSHSLGVDSKLSDITLFGARINRDERHLNTVLCSTRELSGLFWICNLLRSSQG